MAIVLKTDGGPHAPEDWARATVDILLQLGPELQGVRRLAAERMRVAMIEALVPHHAGVQQRETAALVEHGHARYRHDATEDSRAEAAEAFEALVACATGTEWEKIFADPAKRDAARFQIASHFLTDRDIHRQWHADRNPSDAARAFKASRHGHSQEA